LVSETVKQFSACRKLLELLLFGLGAVMLGKQTTEDREQKTEDRRQRRDVG